MAAVPQEAKELLGKPRETGRFQRGARVMPRRAGDAARLLRARGLPLGEILPYVRMTCGAPGAIKDIRGERSPLSPNVLLLENDRANPGAPS